VRLTPAGRAFFPEARRLLRLADGAALTVKRVARGEAGSLTIGFTAGSTYSFLPRLVSFTAAEMPDVDLVLKEMRTVEQMEALAASRIDVGLVRLPIDRRGVEVLCVVREPLMLAVPCNHPLAAGREPRIKDVNQQLFIMYSPNEGRYFYDLLAELFRSADVTPKYVQYIGQIHTILALVSAGMGIALVPKSAQKLNFHGVVIRPIRLKPDALAELFMVWRRNNENPALGVLRDLMVDRFMEKNG
jgi:DNA-binding transcriptional LysR family regulator